MTQPIGGYTHDTPLRARIQAFSPDEPGIVFPFSARLARENGWTGAFAGRVVEEYRRFLYLAMTAGHPVTPSVQVDQAWHLHLTYTRSYWDALCGRVLGRPLHHEPTRGGRAEGGKFVDGYARTLDSYRRAFGHEPPADVWPAPGERFAARARIRQISEATHWIIRKPRVGRGLRSAAAGAGVLVAAAACTGAGGDGWLWAVAALVCVAVFRLWRKFEAESVRPVPARRKAVRSASGRAPAQADGGGAAWPLAGWAESSGGGDPDPVRWDAFTGAGDSDSGDGGDCDSGGDSGDGGSCDSGGDSGCSGCGGE